MLLEKLSLFSSKRDFFLFLFTIFFILSYSLLIEYHNYKTFTRFDSNLVDATILKQYKKTKLTKKGTKRTYQILKLKSDLGFSFYTITKNSFPKNIGKKVKLEVWAGDISFYNYLTNFFAYSKVLSIDDDITLKQKLNNFIESTHQDKNISNIYQALYTATPLNKQLQTKFSTLGISHLLAISGFHLGVLSFLLFFLLKQPYNFFQNRYFPYRSSKVDMFMIVSSLLLLYLLFLDSPASLLRAFSMLIIGFILYDRGFKIISMQTLFLTTILLLAFFPKLIFSLGFWLSISGVFYIFLFFIHFKNLNKIWQFILIPIWVYLMMLPYSLVIFKTFSIYHPLSIIFTTLFTLFYPLSIFFHIVGLGDIFDSLLKILINLGDNHIKIDISKNYLLIYMVLSLLSIWKKGFLYLLLFFSFSFLIYSFKYFI